jgi:hypothetical protein
MIRRINAMGMLALSIAGFGRLAPAQSTSQITLVIDLQNVVEYQGDVGDPQQFATNPNITTGMTAKNFGFATVLGDIVAVNGQPAKGTYVGKPAGIQASPAPTGGGAITDITRAALRDHVFEILKPDGTQVGSIMSIGLSGGSGPPSGPPNEKGNWAIVGGTGAFLGARGAIGVINGSGRVASVTENPGMRRINGGTSFSFYIHLIPMSAPQIISTPNGPAVTHSVDFTLVSPSKPAAAGEVLSLFATGLGPTIPEVDLGIPFPASPLANVNSPVSVTVNGQAADVLAAVGYPGAVDAYQVNFRMPPGIPKGNATVQVTAAWIPGAPVGISVQ